MVLLVSKKGSTLLDDYRSKQGGFHTCEIVVEFQKIFKQVNEDWEIGKHFPLFNLGWVTQEYIH